MTTEPCGKKSKGLALFLGTLLGPLGIDKFYVGATTLGLIQLLLCFTIFGLSISLPWALISMCALIFLVLASKKKTMLYPDVDWEEDKWYDYLISVVVLVSLLGVLFAGGAKLMMGTGLGGSVGSNMMSGNAVENMLGGVRNMIPGSGNYRFQ